ncbi:zinc ribbon domain-containing protein [Haloechinothrix halophila]|uniref:zinc ribbon domain-containing protein n=1 Tax=Haloechinothrix halophila TaxID=1069073 RepID=UPI0004075736|nr:zinc ribbon domain-containing protein [Haloechinothrix halophila]
MVSERDFVAAQAVRAARPTADGTTRTYLLTGLVLCGVCERRMEAHWVHGRAGYRCRHGQTSSQRRALPRVKNVYVREDQLLAALAEQQGQPDHPSTLAAELRQHDMKIVVSATGWTLASHPEPQYTTTADTLF